MIKYKIYKVKKNFLITFFDDIGTLYTYVTRNVHNKLVISHYPKFSSNNLLEILKNDNVCEKMPFKIKYNYKQKRDQEDYHLTNELLLSLI